TLLSPPHTACQGVHHPLPGNDDPPHPHSPAAHQPKRPTPGVPGFRWNLPRWRSGSAADGVTPAAYSPPALASALGVLFEELHRVANGQDGFRCVIGNLAAELLFEGHHEFDRVEAVGAEIIDETRAFGDLVGLDAQMLHDNLLHPLADITHRLNL